jgi:hypothetical protein
MMSDGLPAEGIVAAFEFAELRHVRWQLGNQATSTVLVVEGAISGHDPKQMWPSPSFAGYGPPGLYWTTVQ